MNKHTDDLNRLMHGCEFCKPSCNLCLHQNAWDTIGKPKICNECENYSKFTSEDNFCSNCGKPLTWKGVMLFCDRIHENWCAYTLSKCENFSE